MAGLQQQPWLYNFAVLFKFSCGWLQVIKDTIFNMSSMNGSKSSLPDATALIQQAINSSPDASLVEPMQE